MSVVTNRSPMTPQPTGASPRLTMLADVRVVLLDVYGTLLISGSGDVGTADDPEGGPASAAGRPDDPAGSPDNPAGRPDDPAGTPDGVATAMAAVGLAVSWAGGNAQRPTIRDLHTEIRRRNECARSDANPKPEIEILDVWEAVLRQAGRNDVADDPVTVAKLASHFESIANPTWPMPGAAAVLKSLRDRGFTLGLVSNAQTFTIDLIEDLIGGPLADTFDLNVCFFSNRYASAKPAPRMFDRVVGELRRDGHAPGHALYVGNDMLNDVWAASRAGLRTALFAGDDRSLRWRTDDLRCNELKSDLVLTDWLSLVDCLPSSAVL